MSRLPRRSSRVSAPAPRSSPAHRSPPVLLDNPGLYPQYNPMPKINVYLPDDLAAAVRDAQIPVSAVCQNALERAVRDVTSLRATDEPPLEDDPGRGMFGRFTP